MKRDDRPYYAERAKTERYLSEAPLDENSRFLHLELALRYEALAFDQRFDPAKLTAEKSRLRRRKSQKTGKVIAQAQAVQID